MRPFISNCHVCDEHVATRDHHRSDIPRGKGYCDCCAAHIFKVRHPGRPDPTIPACIPVVKPFDGERFKTIPAYPNYLISSAGRVINERTNRDLRPRSTESGGQRSVMLYNDKGRASFAIHRLVAEAFMKDFVSSRSVTFKDGDKTNGHITNLRLGKKKVKR